MSEQDQEAELDSASQDETTETEENQTSDIKSSNKSNFKELAKSLKTERASTAQLAQELAEEREARKQEAEELKAWRSENPDLVEKHLWKSKSSDKGELALFLVQNPEARNALAEIQEFASDTWYDLEKAWKYVKPTIQESTSSKDFSIGTGVAPKKVDLSKVSFAEAYEKEWDNFKFTDAQRAEWRKLNG